MDSSELRSQFPVLSRLAYLNAGTDGPLPAAAVEAAQHELAAEAENGRASSHFERRKALGDSLRGAYAAALGAPAERVALTTCTSEGISIVVEGMGLGPGDEILTSDEEHPGLLGALAVACEAHGASVRFCPFSEIAEQLGPRTRLIACSHVSWMTGEILPADLTQVKVPVLLDGAQGVGAVPVDVAALGCDAYAGAGQKWLCGPDGLGMLYVSERLQERLAPLRRGYVNMADSEAGIAARLHDDARRFDTQSLSAETLACALASIEILAAAGWPAVLERAAALAGRLAEMLTERGRTVISDPGGTLVSFTSEDPAAERDRLADRGVILRDIPGRPWLRASVGAWNDESDLRALLDGLSG